MRVLTDQEKSFVTKAARRGFNKGCVLCVVVIAGSFPTAVSWD